MDIELRRLFHDVTDEQAEVTLMLLTRIITLEQLAITSGLVTEQQLQEIYQRVLRDLRGQYEMTRSAQRAGRV